MELVFLGTGAGGGVPWFCCGCKACQEALADESYRRTRSAIALVGDETIVIDAPSELATQLSRQKIENIDYFALTHWHYDHFGGLGDLEFYVRFHRTKALPAVMTPETWEQLQASFGFMTEYLEVTTVEPGQAVDIGGVRLTALAVTHVPGAAGFLVEHGGKRLAYLPDTGPLPAGTREQVLGIECLLLDATFWGRNWYPGRHLSFSEAIATGRELGVQQLYLTHLAMHYDTPVTSRELEDVIEPYGGQVRLAYDGLRLAL